MTRDSKRDSRDRYYMALARAVRDGDSQQATEYLREEVSDTHDFA